MSTYGKKLLDATGNVILPKTRSNLVYHGSTLLSTKINNIDTEITNIKNGTTKVAKATTADNANAVAWNNVSGKPSSFTPSSHNQAASTISTGRFPGTVYAKAANTSLLCIMNCAVWNAGGTTMFAAQDLRFIRQ